MTKFMKFLIVPALLVAFVTPVAAQAQTYTATAYQTSAQQQQIAYLYALVAQLQAQLNALLAAGATSQSTSNYVTITGENVSDSDNNSVELSGTASVKQSGTVRVWFEYGTTQSVGYSTESREISAHSGNNISFYFTAPDIDSNRTYYYRAVAQGNDGRYAEGSLKSFNYSNLDSNNSNHNSNNNEPDVTTDNADDIDTDSARLSGSVDMNDFENGTVFLVYGEDKSEVENVADENTYSDINTDGYNLRKVSLTSNLDSDDTFEKTVTSLHDDTKQYFRLCVQFINDNDDDQLVCGDVESFYTDNN